MDLEPLLGSHEGIPILLVGHAVAHRLCDCRPRLTFFFLFADLVQGHRVVLVVFFSLAGAAALAFDSSLSRLLLFASTCASFDAPLFLPDSCLAAAALLEADDVLGADGLCPAAVGASELLPVTLLRINGCGAMAVNRAAQCSIPRSQKAARGLISQR